MNQREKVLAGLFAIALVAAAAAGSIALGEKRRADEARAAYAEPRDDAFAAWAREFEGAAIPLQAVNLSTLPPEDLAFRLRLASVQLNDGLALTRLLFDTEPRETGEAVRAFEANLSAFNQALFALVTRGEAGNLTEEDVRQAREYKRSLDGLAGLTASARVRAAAMRSSGELVPYAAVLGVEDWRALAEVFPDTPARGQGS